MSHCHALYRSDQVRELDRRAIEQLGIPGGELMRRAGGAVFGVLRARWPEARSVTVCCGGGNNGGDGYVVARLAREAGLDVQVIALKSPDDLKGDAAGAARDWLAGNGTPEPPERAIRGEVIVDALLGTGLEREVRDPYAGLIRRINDSGLPVLSVDVPSGLNADTGMPMGPAVRAWITVTFIGRKRGLYTGEAGDWCGRVIFDGLNVPAETYRTVAPDAESLSENDLRRRLPQRLPSCHKGDLGHVLIAGGDHGMAGAVMLAARAALAAGSGLVSVATRPEHAAAMAAVRPEAMWHGVDDDLPVDLLNRASVIALGPGLGQGEWSRRMFERAMAADCSLVVDADGLNLLAEHPSCRSGFQPRQRCPILTPHPGEAARLLDCSTEEIQSDRFAAVRAIAEQYQAICVLKGHGSLIANPAGAVSVCDRGTPAMATAGMGDALTGIVASLLGQGLEAFDAARCGVLLHALAGERAASGRRCIRAGELIEALGSVDTPAGRRDRREYQQTLDTVLPE